MAAQFGSAMDLTISFLTESRAPAWGLPPLRVAYFTGKFASLDDARAGSRLQMPTRLEIRASSVLIQSVDGSQRR